MAASNCDAASPHQVEAIFTSQELDLIFLYDPTQGHVLMVGLQQLKQGRKITTTRIPLAGLGAGPPSVTGP